MGVIPEELYIGDHDLETIWNNCIFGGANYLEQHSAIESMIVGVSGGMDSALTCAFARAAADRVNAKLIGWSIPILTNEADELYRAKAVGEVFCHHFAEVDLSKECVNLVQSIDNSLFYEMYAHEASRPHGSRIRAGNIKARLRMMYLYDKARKYNGIVLSTDNYTEYLLGFWTLHGDVGDFGFIQQLWKTEVYALAEYAAKREFYGSSVLAECIEANATDGLGVSDGDLDQLLPGWDGSSRDGYREVDDLLINYINADEANAMHPVIERHLRTHYKRNNPVSLDRLKLVGLVD